MMNPRFMEIVAKKFGRDPNDSRVNELMDVLNEKAPLHGLHPLEVMVLWEDYSEGFAAGWLTPDDSHLESFLLQYGIEAAPSSGLRY